MTRRRRLSEEERREQLIELAIDLFGRSSFDDVSIDDVAGRAGISKGLMYHYFRSKRDLYVAAVQRAADQLLDALEPPADLPTQVRLVQGFDAYLDYVEQSPQAYVSLVRGGVGVDAEVAEIIEQARTRIAGIILDGLGFGQPTVLQRLAVRGWLAASEQTCLTWLAERPFSRERLVSFLMAALLAIVSAVGEEA